jgi:hypothetical protein
MKVLASRIVEALKTADHFAVYEADLERFWPLLLNHREAKIAEFAQEYGFRLRFYKPGLCAIFDLQQNVKATKKPEVREATRF